MNRRLLGAALLLGFVAEPAIAGKFAMQLKPAIDQSARIQNGVAAVDSHSETLSVRLIQHEGILKKRGSIQLLLMNHGESPLNFGPENVTAKLSDGTPIAIITYERLVKEEKKRQMWAAIAVGLAAAGNSMSAANSGYVSGSGTYSGSTYGSFGGTPYNSNTFGTVSYSGYDYGRAQIGQSIANQQNQANFARLADTNAARMEGLKTYMRTTTVDPQNMFGGTVMFELPKSAQKSKTHIPATFTVTANGQEHTFEVMLLRQ